MISKPVLTFLIDFNCFALIFIDFNGFVWFRCDFLNFVGVCIRFHRFQWSWRSPGVGCLTSCCILCKRNDAPIETFTRSQLAAISSIFIDFWRFHEIT